MNFQYYKASYHTSAAQCSLSATGKGQGVPPIKMTFVPPEMLFPPRIEGKTTKKRTIIAFF